MHFADDAEAPLAAARDVDDAAPLVTAAREGRLAATWAETPDHHDAARAASASASGLVMLCHSLLLAASTCHQGGRVPARQAASV